MTQANPSYTLTTMNSTDVYNYMKRLARKTSNDMIDCVAEAIIAAYRDDTQIRTNELKQILTGRMTDLEYREMQCEVTTSMRSVPAYEAHVD